jgi:short-subunit dehydrogenase
MKRHAIVVGGSSGLGRAIADALEARGDVVSSLARRGPIPCDVTQDDSVKNAIASAIDRNGAPDICVYAAGMPAMGKTLSVPAEAARAAFEVNFWGMDRVVRAVLPEMAKRQNGVILGLSSIAALRPIPHEAYYSASKAALARYLGCLAHEAREQNVRVKILSVGFVDTGFFSKGGWFGMNVPSVSGSGITPNDVAKSALEFLDGDRTAQLLGWRERAIALADRVAPDLYDRVIDWRSKR